ncbi:MAG: hypothetical protein HC919_14310, partial [Oscillatoriales cyanobacterium SM2_2_1]|nr:hypothetical protein [Oscillatoriales cyanobacterium SM2_2_1]
MAVVGGWLARLKPKRLAIAEACVIGLLVGVVAVLLKTLVGEVGGLRLQVAQMLPYGLGLPLFGGMTGAIAGWLTMSTPQTAG